ncbi:MAG: recombination protein RecR [Ignavibacteriota bacterium]|nr:recombination protein RecR [Ignavibacteriales bacterium]MBL1121476.1 recombination protein RecR [Ignavibacteriota bacterium]MBV6419489.1 Recombination protein RecR [Ignavibacteriaceae bacterium]MCE7857019.1 recombination protein RecR [Ignavibacteria bacterium CHB3]MEB2295374.1 recombination mediator RecR [Ignavibacteria bacterium]
MQIAEPLLVAIEELSKLPGIGKKTAQRLAIHLLKCEDQQVERLITAIQNLKLKLRFCSRCFNLSEEELCSICTSEKRDKSVICVVEEASDVMAVEKTHEYKGLYHVLGGVLSPLSGITPESLHIKELLKRFEEEEIKEVILALNPDTEGETTSLYLAKILKPIGIKVTRIARGLPIGGDLEFADDATIGRAILNRSSL